MVMGRPAGVDAAIVVGAATVVGAAVCACAAATADPPSAGASGSCGEGGAWGWAAGWQAWGWRGFAAFYLTVAALAFLPRIPLKQREGDPLFLYAAPFCVWKWKMSALLNLKESLSWTTRTLLFFRWWLLLFDQAFWHLMWTLDDVLFPAYRSVDLKGSVFIVGGFRTGSTSLHRTLALDEERFVSPRMLEIVYPFLVVHLWLDFLEWLDAKLGTPFIHMVDELYKRVCGPELLARHPMSFYEAEEDDLLFAINYGVGWYSAIQFPSASVWMQVGQISKFSPRDKRHLFCYYQRVMQKVLWRRGRGRTLLSKSHLIEFVGTLGEHIPEAKFVDIVRHPKDSFVSWLALQQAGSRNFTRFQFPLDEAVQLHQQFWDLFFAKEMELFNGPGVDKSRYTQLSFKEYCLGPDKVVKQLYGLWGVPLTLGMHQALTEAKKEHESYKQVHQYRNPTLQELGLSLAEVEAHYAHYIRTVRVAVSHNPQDKHPAPILPAALTRGVSLLSSISSPPSTSPLPPEAASDNEEAGDTEDDDSVDAIEVEEKSGSVNGSGHGTVTVTTKKKKKKALLKAGAGTSTDSSSSSSAGSSPRMVEVAAADS